MNFEGVSLDACIDRKIEVYDVMVRSSRCAAYSLKKLYKNVWIVQENQVGWMCILHDRPDISRGRKAQGSYRWRAGGCRAG
ncbi:MAG: hypothetical protein ACLURV_02850 [Gallintestinimicrobium sp.]